MDVQPGNIVWFTLYGDAPQQQAHLGFVTPSISLRGTVASVTTDGWVEVDVEADPSFNALVWFERISSVEPASAAV